MIFSDQIFCHKECYSSYLTEIRKKRFSEEKTKNLNERKECEMHAMKKILELFRKKVLIDRNAYLMTELIQDIHKVSLENGLKDAIRNISSSFLKKGLPKNSEFYWILYCWENRLFNAMKLTRVNALWLH